MRQLILSILFLFLATGILAKPVPVDVAMTAANNAFAFYQGRQVEMQFREMAYSQENRQVFYYIFSPAQPQEHGFIIIAGDDAAIPVLGYSRFSDYSDNPPPSFRKWMEWYRLQIQEIWSQGLEADEQISGQWERFLNPIPSAPLPSIQKAVSPLLTTKWNQAPYYNAQCPYDNAEGERTVTGCVATAMAQIMKYWEYPAQGTGNHSYVHNTYGTLSANFASATYNWASMPNSVNSSNTAVATLMYHCGVAVEMDYGVASGGGSGAYVINSHSPVTHCSEYAFKTYFDYDPSLTGEARENYTQTNWIAKLKAELDAGRPILYAGFGQGGHAFVCDGYDNNSYFHFNWGWGGIYDGYFSINSLNPGTGGAGAGAGTYNNGQQAIFNLKPKAGGGGGNTPANLELYSNITLNPDPVSYLDAFEVKVSIANTGGTAITGDFAAAVFNSDNEFIDFVDVINDGSINGSSVGLATFTSSGMSDLVPGQYVVGIYFRQGSQDWLPIDPGGYSNFKTFTVVGVQGDIRLYAPVLINPNPVERNKPLTISFDVANYSDWKTFEGTVSIDLHKSDGAWIRELDAMDNLTLPPMSHFTNGLTFNLSGLPDDPGNYKLQIWYQPDGEQWQLMGSGTYSNPVSLTIAAPGLSPDPYESNNTQGTAKTMSVVFTGNTASVKTVSANIHTGTDLDYYKLVFDPGYDYTITARVHDAYNSGDGKVYSCDVTVAYLKDGTWSDYYDDIIPGQVLVENGGTLIYSVSPYFTGKTGTYLLDIQISRVKRNNTIVQTPLVLSELTVYPNPVHSGEAALIELTHSDPVTSITAYTADGRLVGTQWEQTSDNRVRLVQELPPGVYFLRVQQAGGIRSVKLVVSE